MSELVINQSTWMDTGEPVHDVIQLQNACGMAVNVEANDEPPLVLGRCACNAGAAAEGNVPPWRDSNYGDNDPATGYGLGLSGHASLDANTPASGEDSNADTYGDAAEMEHRRAKLRADLGLTTEENPERARQQRDAGIRPFPGAPAKSFG